MKGLKLFVAAAVALWLGGGLEQSLPQRLGVAGGSPDFLLIALACLALLTDRRGGLLLGFAAGLTQGALAGANLAAYVVTRTLGGFLVGWFNDLEMEANSLLAFFVALLLTLFAQILLMFGVHRGPVLPFLTGTMVSALINGVLAMPVYALLRRFVDPPSR